jgi:hypothetical protein
MSYIRTSAILCIDGFKEKSLYFDRVLPLYMGNMRGDKEAGDVLLGYPEEIPSAALSHLIDGVEGNTTNFSHAKRIMGLFTEGWSNFSKEVSPYVNIYRTSSDNTRFHNSKIEQQEILQAYLTDTRLPNVQPIRTIVSNFAKEIGFDKYSIAIPPSPEGNQIDPAITLSNINLIDANSAEWNQIIEIRKDVESSKQLNRLRLFMHENFEGKPLTYIEDDLCRRMDLYEQASNKFGFKTITSSLSMLLDAKSLQAAVGTGLVAGLIGGPVVGALTTASIEVGKVAINIAEKHHEMKSWQNNHELAYIFNTVKSLS